MKKLAMIIGVMAAVIASVSQGVSASGIYTTGNLGIDISYPNCSAVVPAVSFGVVGVNNGLVYGHNGCAAAEAAQFKDLSLYVNTGLNTSSTSTYYTQAQAGCNGDVNCAAYNYGANAATDAINYANSLEITSQKWWLDVETGNTWNADVLQNQKSLQGEYDVLVAHGATTVGVYSTTYQWQSITGGWHNNWPNWGATVLTTAKQASTYCTGHQFTGGPSLLIQYKSKQSKIDQDIAC